MLRSGKSKTPVAYPPKGEEAPGVFVHHSSATEARVVTPISLTLLERRLSAERLAPYRTATGGDLTRAVALYEWNAQVSAAFWATLGHVEVLIRNAMHEQLTVWSAKRFGQPLWYLDPGRVLTEQARRDIATARQRATRDGRAETPGRVVAELNLSFWRFLLAARYERSLWRTCLWRAWPGQGLRRIAHDRLAEVHMLRNRIAHHEPIHNRPLAELHATALIAAGWVCPATGAWIEADSQVEPLVNARPDAADNG